MHEWVTDTHEAWSCWASTITLIVVSKCLSVCLSVGIVDNLHFRADWRKDLREDYTQVPPGPVWGSFFPLSPFKTIRARSSRLACIHRLIFSFQLIPVGEHIWKAPFLAVFLYVFSPVCGDSNYELWHRERKRSGKSWKLGRSLSSRHQLISSLCCVEYK